MKLKKNQNQNQNQNFMNKLKLSIWVVRHDSLVLGIN